MKKLFKTVLFVLAFQVSGARAEDCSTTVYGKYATDYQYQVLRVMGSPDPIGEAGTTLTCGNWWFDIWAAKSIVDEHVDPKTKLKTRDTFGNEVDFSAAYDTSFDTHLGTFKVEVYGSYGAVPEFKRVDDDIIQLYIDVGRPFTVHSATLTPYVRAIPILGLGVYPNRLIIRSGGRFAVPLTTGVSFNADVATTSDLYAHTVTKRFVPAVSYSAGDGWSFGVDGKFADGLKPEFEIGFAKKL